MLKKYRNELDQTLQKNQEWTVIIKTIVNEMLTEIINAEPGKRQWIKASDNDRWWIYNYTLTIKSTFPEWSKFYFTRNKYKANQYWKKLIERWMWWTKKQMINILKKFLEEKNLTQKQKMVLKTSFENYIWDRTNEFDLYGEDYFKNLLWNWNFIHKEEEIIYYDEKWNIIWFWTEYDIDYIIS